MRKAPPMPATDRGQRWNRDNEQKPGAPPRSAYEPKGSEASTRTKKTMTDAASGEPTGERLAPNRAKSDEVARRPR